MKKILLLALPLAFVLVSCSPSKYFLSVEMRNPSRSGIQLAGKEMSVSYLDDGVSEDSLFVALAAEKFVEVLEEDYFEGDEVIGLYKVENDPEDGRSAREKMVQLVIETGVDVAFVFEYVPLSTNDKSFEMRLHIYDSMNQEDTVQIFRGTSTLRQGTAMIAQAEAAGNASAQYFISTWENDRFAFYYYDSGDWAEALDYASNYKLQEAMDLWLGLVTKKNLYKRSCAEFNLATACYIMGKIDLAGKWLDRSDVDYPLAESYSLRKKINNKK